MTAVCVLGMSRSGTSLTARVLNLAGVYLGSPEELLSSDLRELPERDRERARAANAGGFWEHYRLMRLNERILKAFGGNWREPPELSPGWEDSPELASLREEANALLESSFSGHELWGWKDPRNSLTLPFWQRLLPEMRYVICLRNPIDVAASLRCRDGLSPEQAFDLWLIYVASALVNTSGSPRLLVPYESHFEDPQRLADRLARFVGREGAFDATEARRRQAEAIDERLWRHRTSLEDLVSDPRLPREVLSLHLLVELLVTMAPPRSDDRAGGLARKIDAFARQLMHARSWRFRAPA